MFVHKEETMRSVGLLTAIAAAIITCMAFAQQRQSVEVTPSSKVFIGQQLGDAKKAMTRRKIEFHEGGFALVKGDPDESNWIVIIDKSLTYACVWYSKSKSQVTRLSMVFRPHRQAVKPEQSWLPATELLLNEDRSYSVKFKPPLTDEEIKKLEENRTRPQGPPINRN